MKQDWMIDVLSDLKTFAGKNGYARLMEQLDDTIHIAVTELAEREPASIGASSNGSTKVDTNRSEQAC